MALNLALPLVVLFAFASAVGTQGQGTVAALFPQPGLTGDPASWILPNAGGSGTGTCTNLDVPPPAGTGFGSAKVWWDGKDGLVVCDKALHFYSVPDCRGKPAFDLLPGHKPPRGSWEFTVPDLQSSMYSALATTQSVLCESTKPPPSSSTADMGPAAAPITDAAAFTVWLDPLNKARSDGNPVARPLAWNSYLATMAQSWTEQMSKEMCDSPRIVLRKIPNSGFSESDVWMSFSQDPAEAVTAWAPDVNDTMNPRTARILDSNAQSVGCGSTACKSGGFFTCLFTPIKY